MDKKLATLATKLKLKIEQNKIVKTEALDSGYFYGKNFFGDGSVQNMFVYQPTVNMLELKKEKVTDYVID